MDKELPISPWPEWKIVSKIGEGSLEECIKLRELRRDVLFTRQLR